MTATSTLIARQARAGQPISTTELHKNVAQAEYDAWSSLGVGAKVGATLPTNTSQLSGVLHSNEGPGRRSYGDQTRQISDGATLLSFSYVASTRRSIALDSNYVAGRYVFAYQAAGDGTILAVSAPYHIL